MSDLRDKITRAANAFAEIITEDVSSTQNLSIYKYNDFKSFVNKKINEYPEIVKCTISIMQGREFEDKVYSENKYIIRMVMLDEESRPICMNGKDDEFVGAVIISSAIDKRLKDFMGEKTEKTIVIGGKRE